MADSVINLLTRARKAAFVSPVVLTLAVSAFAQSNSPTPRSASPAYDVISIRPSRAAGYTAWRPRPDGVLITNIELWQLVYGAFDVRLDDQVKGLPGWAHSDQFDIQAKMGEEAFAALQKLPPKDQAQERQELMRALLSDRFKLRLHHETKERPIYELVKAQGGCKLKESPPGEPQRMMAGRGRVITHATPLISLVANLPDATGRLVVDETGLTGNYDITLKWTPDDQRGADDAGPSIFTALEEQLGLKLVPARGPVNTLVIDHVERPSPN